MVDFFEISHGMRIGLLSVIFIVVTASVFFLLYLLKSEKRFPAKISLAILSTINTVILIIYTSEMDYFFYTGPLNKKTEKFMDIPVIFFCIPVVILSIEIIILIIKELKTRRMSITGNSVKESFDSLPAGLCFSNPDGRIQLYNHVMSELCYAITDAELQNADLFWKTLSYGSVSKNIRRISSGETPEFRLPDGSIWIFRKTQLDEENIQITATDITQLYNLTKKLKEKNEVLTDMNVRLRKYGENVDELTRSRERLETKERIHNSLGQALLVTRHSIDSGKNDVLELVEMWKRNISVLKTGAGISKEEYNLDVLFNAAHSAGITIDLSGEMPGNGEIRKLFVIAATQALVNAVRHAGAKTLYIAFVNSTDTCSVRFTNDGKRPEAEVTEGGGLENLRKRVEIMNGTMRIISKPRYILEIIIDKKADDNI